MKPSIRKYNLILFFLLTALNPLFSQDSLIVSGKIVASKNKPIKDVSVSIEGMETAPVLTAEDGTFVIPVPHGNVGLIINPLGNYKSKRVFLNNRKQLTISLTEQDMESGYDAIQVINQTENRRDMVGSFADIDIGQAQQRNIVSIDQAFQGKVAGMLTTNHSGMPGQGAVSFIRGINSMNANASPLVIVDGIPLEETGIFGSSIDGNAYNPLTTIDPSDISKVTILKDPTFTALYGTKASNGIILIETLQPTSTETSINFSFQTGLNYSENKFIPQLNDVQYKTLANEMLTSSPLQEENFDDEYPGLYKQPGDIQYYRYIHNTNWQKLIFANALLTEAYVSVKGGSDIATYGLSVGYHDQGGILEGTSYNRFNVRFVSDLNIFPWLDVDVNANLSNNNAYLRESAISHQTNPIITSLGKPPILDPYQYDETGQRLDMIDDVDELGTSNPLAITENFEGENKNYRFISSIVGQADISESLNLNTLLGLNFNTLKEAVFKPNHGMENYFDGEARNVSQSTNDYLFSFYNDNHLDFSKQFGSIHDLNASVGFRINTNSLQIDYAEAKNMPANDQFSDLETGQRELDVMGGENGTWNWLSLYNRISYKLMDKYILNTGISLDYSTRTGGQAETALHVNDMPVGLFYSFSAGWRISNESFLNNVKGLDNLLLRASYGTSGNDDIGNFNATPHYRTTKYRETSGLIPGTIPNEMLTFEKSVQYNAGLDLNLWGSRTAMSVDYFMKKTEDLLIFEPIKAYIGYHFRPTNAGTVENKGWEFSFFQRIIDGQKFDWDFSTNLSLISNKMAALEGEGLVTSFEGGEFITRKGDPINTFYGYQFEGVFSTYEEAQEADMVNNKGMAFGPGDAIYQDISGPEGEPDGVIDDNDKVALGSPIPDYFGSLSNRFTYNRWSLNVMVQFVYGQEVFNYARYMNERMVDLSNQSDLVLKRWQSEGDDTNVPRALWNDPVGNSSFSSRWIEDGSYVRLKSVRLAYTVPEQFLVFNNASFYVTATNLITLDKYLGYDPEFSYSFNPMQQGIDYGLMPQYRQFLFGMKLGL